MRSTEKIHQALERLVERLQRFGEAAFPEEHGDGLAPIRTMEDRDTCIHFMKTVYHDGMDERVYAAKWPEKYARVVAIAGTVPRRET